MQKLKALRDKLNVLEGYASDTQIFLGIRKISKELNDQTEEVKFVTEEPIIILKELQLAAPFQTFLSEVKLLGHVQNDQKLTAFQPTKLHKNQSHVSVPVLKPLEYIEIQNVVKIIVNNKSQTEISQIWSAVVLPNRLLVFKWTDSNNLVTYTSEGEFVRYQPIVGNVTYMAVVDSERLAFSYENSKVVCIYNIQTQQIERTITFMEICYRNGLSYDGRYLYAVGETTILCVELADDLGCISAIQVKTNDVAFLSVRRDKLYYADYEKQTVYCSNKNGEEIWSFNNEIMMKYPIGITTDQYGNTYVTCANSNKVLVISADGKRFKELLKKSFTCLQW